MRRRNRRGKKGTVGLLGSNSVVGHHSLNGLLENYYTIPLINTVIILYLNQVYQCAI